MTIRNDITVDYTITPRIADVDVGSNEVSVQDSHDTLTTIQDGNEGHQFPDLVATEGGLDLGAGVSVGLSTTLKDVQYAFARTSSIHTGNTSSTNNTYLIDSLATFVSDGVTRGDWIINFTDQSVSEVLIANNETQLLCNPLTDGTTNIFTSGDKYKVWNVEQCKLTGGNFIGIDAEDVDLFPLFTTFGRFASLTSASSATDQNSLDIQFASFGGGVTIDVVGGTAGTVFPAGTPRQPVDNLEDAKQIIINQGLPKVCFILGDIIFGAPDVIDDFEIRGSAVDKTTATLVSGVSTLKTEFFDLELTGVLGGAINVFNCHMIAPVTNIGSTIVSAETIFHDTIFEAGTFTLFAGATQRIVMVNCHSGVTGHGGPIIDFNGSSAVWMCSNWSGGIQFDNITTGTTHAIHMNSGHVFALAGCTSGTMLVHGGTIIDDNSTGSFILDISGVVNEDTIASAVWNAALTAHVDPNTFGGRLQKILTKIQNLYFK